MFEMDNLNIFDFLFPKYKIVKPIRLIECFAGIGSQVKALKRLQKEYNFHFDHYRVIEFDKYAIASYNAVHDTSFETSDITQIHANDLGIIDTDKYDYIMTYSFPCQDLSLAGKRKGMSKGSGTRSGLLWEVERILDECEELPQILLMENVPQVISSNNANDFREWQLKLEKLGYSNYVSLLNSKDYGIPQNRNRCFMISILGQYNYSFPKPFKLKLRLKDILEKEVDEKYYLSEKLINGFLEHTQKQKEKGNSFCWKTKTEDDIASTLTAHIGFGATDNSIIVKQVGNIVKTGNFQNPQRGRIYSINGLSPCLNTCGGGNLEPKVIVNSVQNQIAENYNIRIRKLTPLEFWRLMGFNDEDFCKAAKVNSNAQLYKQAGNSIVVDVLYYIFKEFF